MTEDTKLATPEKPKVWWQEALMAVVVFGGFSVLILALSHACTTASEYRSEHQIRAERTARVFAAACMKDARRGRYDCVEACRTSPDQMTCIEEVNTLSPQYQPNPNRNSWQ